MFVSPWTEELLHRSQLANSQRVMIDESLIDLSIMEGLMEEASVRNSRAKNRVLFSDDRKQ